MRKLVLLTLIAALTAVGVVPATAAAKAPTRYYLSLGDSLAAGYQKPPTGGDSLSPNKYANLIHQRLKRRNPGLKLVNYACPGESTTSYLNGGCPYPLSEAQKKSQSARALRFLRKNRRRTALVTISLAANNLLPCVNGVAVDIACVGAGQMRLGDELPRILKSLRKAGGKRLKMAVLVPYNPFVALYLVGAEYQGLALTSDSLVQGVRDTIIGAARPARFHVANGYVAFQSGNLDQVTDFNGTLVPVAVARVCQLTTMCVPPPGGPDVHPTDAGYRKLYEAFRRVLKF